MGKKDESRVGELFVICLRILLMDNCYGKYNY